MWSNAQIIDIEYPQQISSPISVVEDFLDYLHIHLFNQRFSISIMYDTLSDFINWLNYNILYLSSDITIPQKNLKKSFDILFHEIKVISVLKEWKQFRQ